jgi:hypothetical protein
MSKESSRAEGQKREGHVEVPEKLARLFHFS